MRSTGLPTYEPLSVTRPVLQRSESCSCSASICKTASPRPRAALINGRTLFGGPSQPEPNDERGGIRAAERLAQESGGAIINPNQYENSDVSLCLDQRLAAANEVRTGKLMSNGPARRSYDSCQILTSSVPEWAQAVSSGLHLTRGRSNMAGTMTGLGTYFKEAKPSVYRLG